MTKMPHSDLLCLEIEIFEGAAPMHLIFDEKHQNILETNVEDNLLNIESIEPGKTVRKSLPRMLVGHMHFGLFIVFNHSDLLFTNTAGSHYVFGLLSRWNPPLSISDPILHIGLLLSLLEILL